MCGITNTEVRGLPCNRVRTDLAWFWNSLLASERETLGQRRDLRSRAGRLCSYGCARRQVSAESVDGRGDLPAGNKE